MNFHNYFQSILKVNYPKTNHLIKEHNASDYFKAIQAAIYFYWY